jgi:hypothetical protein
LVPSPRLKLLIYAGDLEVFLSDPTEWDTQWLSSIKTIFKNLWYLSLYKLLGLNYACLVSLVVLAL